MKICAMMLTIYRLWVWLSFIFWTNFTFHELNFRNYVILYENQIRHLSFKYFKNYLHDQWESIKDLQSKFLCSSYFRLSSKKFFCEQHSTNLYWWLVTLRNRGPLHSTPKATKNDGDCKLCEITNERLPMIQCDGFYEWFHFT